MTRRDLLRFPALGAVSQAADAGRVTVRDVEVHVVRVNARGNWILVRTRASNGLLGSGDASHGGPDAVTLKHLRAFSELFRGAAVSDIERLRQAALPSIQAAGLAAAVAFSALEMSLWDILGQLYSVPACDLLGGTVNPSLRNYANINRSTPRRDPEGFARMAEQAVAAGFDAVKLAPFDDMPRGASGAVREAFTARGIACAAAVRQAIGPRRDLLIDAHNRFDLERGLDLARRLESLDLFWLEEVCPARPSYEQLAAVNREAKMRTAGGESIFGLRGFLPYVNAQAVDVAMPDVKYCGGMLELKKIAALCEAAGMPVSPHGPASPIGNLAAAHVSAAMPNFLILEFSYGEVPWRAELIDPPEELVNGRIHLRRRPGLGAGLNDRTLVKYRA